MVRRGGGKAVSVVNLPFLIYVWGFLCVIVVVF